MKSTLKVHNPRVIVLLICITDGCLEGLKLMHTLENIEQPSLLAVQSHSDSQLLTDGRLEGLELMHTLNAKINIKYCHLASYNSVVRLYTIFFISSCLTFIILNF